MALPHFVELALLRETVGDDPDRLYGSNRPILEDAVERALTGQDVMNHTSLLVIRKAFANSPPSIRELVYSTHDRLWGYELPFCPSCGNSQTYSTRRRNSSYTLACRGCGARTKGEGLKCPDMVAVVERPQFPKDRLFWKPFPSASPWVGHQWESV
jgi:hypothetical protein